jgi:hypothetical protein
MLEQLKLNASGRAEILELYAWMDGGTVTVILATIDNSPCEITFTQKMIKEVTRDNPYPGWLLYNKRRVIVRSDFEAKILAILKRAVFSDHASQGAKDFKSCLKESIRFVKSNAYLKITKTNG